MATKTIVYFLAGAAPTVEEANDISDLNEMALPAYKVLVRNGSVAHKEEISDLVAGTIPADYLDDENFGDIDFDNKPSLLFIAPYTAVIGETATLQLRVMAVTGPLNALVAEDVTAASAGTIYTSSLEAKATVSVNGLVTGIEAGSTVITATYTYAIGKTVTTARTINVSE